MIKDIANVTANIVNSDIQALTNNEDHYAQAVEDMFFEIANRSDDEAGIAITVGPRPLRDGHRVQFHDDLDALFDTSDLLVTA